MQISSDIHMYSSSPRRTGREQNSRIKHWVEQIDEQVHRDIHPCGDQDEALYL
jgi:hypothetical protein